MKICLKMWQIGLIVAVILMIMAIVFRKRLMTMMPKMGRKTEPMLSAPVPPAAPPMSMGGGIAQALGFGKKKYKK